MFTQATDIVNYMWEGTQVSDKMQTSECGACAPCFVSLILAFRPGLKPFSNGFEFANYIAAHSPHAPEHAGRQLQNPFVLQKVHCRTLTPSTRRRGRTAAGHFCIAKSALQDTDPMRPRARENSCGTLLYCKNCIAGHSPRLGL